MHRYSWLVDHPALLALIATLILLVAWPLEYVPALIVSGVLLVVAAGIATRAHFLTQPG
jgi:hypothetical protein